MSLQGFVCPDNIGTPVDDCLKKCRLGERCLTLPTLKLMSRERDRLIWSCPSCHRELRTIDKELIRAHNIR